MVIENSTREFAALLNNVSIGIVIVNDQAEIAISNQFILKLFGYTKDELIGQKIEKLIPKRYKHKHEKDRDNYNAHPRNRTMGIGMDIYAIKKDGTEFPVEVSLSPYQSDDGLFTIAFLSDITIRKKAERDLLQLNQELEEKVEERTSSLLDALEREKKLNEMKSRFVSFASHEFRTPLTNILSSAALIEKYPTTEEQGNRVKHVSRISSAVSNLTNVLNNFLSVEQLENGTFEATGALFNLPVFLEYVMADMDGMLSKKAQYIKYHHGGEVMITQSEKILRNVLLNLLSNASKYSADSKEIHLTSSVEDKRVMITVKDHGIGIPEEDHLKLFTGYFRGHNVENIQGTGLGLSIVKKYIELLGGNISFTSKLNEGTAFTIEFPQVMA